ncbi:MAG: oligosaccharide flippase family protein [Candidatus Rokubacteria bacterium]|nr:oligosaccharide flippase family protein [Candidatus Rokubacteria bacterium]
MRGLLKPYGLTITGTLVSTGLGVVSNKIVATVGGPEVSALVAMFRQLYAGVASGLALGADTTVVQNLAADPSPPNASRVCRIIATYLLVCAGVLALGATFLASWIARALLGPALGASHALEIKLVIVLSFVGLCLTFVMALLNASLRFTQVVLLNIVASATTAACTYFVIVGLPSVGPALVVGLGNVAALGLGGWLLRERIRGAAIRTAVTLANVLALVRPGLMMVGLTFMNLGVMLAVQSLVARRYGLYGLGLYTASSTIISAFMMLFMSPMKSYVLPALGGLASRTDKGALVNSVLRLSLLVIFPFALVLFAFRGRILETLYSAQFSPSAALLAVEVVGVVPKVVTWVLTIYLISDGLFKAYVYTDGLKGVLTLGGCAAVVALGWDLVWVPWTFAASETLCATLCAVYSARLQRFRLSWANGALTLGLALLIAGAYLTDRYRHAL